MLNCAYYFSITFSNLFIKERYNVFMQTSSSKISWHGRRGKESEGDVGSIPHESHA